MKNYIRTTGFDISQTVLEYRSGTPVCLARPGSQQIFRYFQQQQQRTIKRGPVTIMQSITRTQLAT